MPSRIDIGPEGGPFVAINENSNDLELQDINGNVIAVWDETAGQWDFKTNDLANVGGIDATGLTSSLDVGGNDLTNIDAIDASSASVEESNIGSNISTLSDLGDIGPSGLLVGGGITLNDEEQINLSPNDNAIAGGNLPGFYLIAVDGASAVVSFSGQDITIQNDQAGIFSATDTDGNHCIIKDGIFIYLKNRIGSPTTYDVVGIGVNL